MTFFIRKDDSLEKLNPLVIELTIGNPYPQHKKNSAPLI